MSLIWIVNILSVFFLCVFFAGIVIPQILLIAFRRRLFDEPDERKIHQCVVPRLGGMAFKPVVFFSFVLLLAVNVSTGHDELLKEIGAEALPLAYAFCAIIMLYLVGIADDLIGVRYRAKFFIQIVCGIMLVAGGVELSDLHGMLFIHSMPSWISIPLTVFVTVFIINAINLIDGIDGLASGLCILSFVCYGIAFVFCSQNIYALLSFAFVGVLIPFFYYNVFGTQRKRKIFMGDTGSLTLGMMLCFLNIKLTQMPQDSLPHINKYLLAALPLMIPCFDVVRVFAYRLLHGNNPFLPDNNHIHHLLIRTGLSERTTMITLILSSALLTLTNVMLCNDLGVMLLLAADITLWIVVNIIIDLLLKRKEKRTNNSLIEQQ